MDKVSNELEHFVRIAHRNDKSAILNALSEFLAELDCLNAKRNSANKFDSSRDRLRFHRVRLIIDTLEKGLRRIERAEQRKIRDLSLIRRTRALTKERIALKGISKPIELAFKAGREIGKQKKEKVEHSSIANIANSEAFQKALSSLKEREDQKITEELQKSILQDGKEN